MPTRYAACLSTDRRMLPPAAFAASEVKALAIAAGVDIDVLLFTDIAQLTVAERDWLERAGIRLEGAIGTAAWERLVVDPRLSPASLVKLALAPHLAGRYDKLLYLDADITVHADVSPIFGLDTGNAPVAAAPAGRLFVTDRERDKAQAHFRALGMSAPYQYFNTGVLLIDVDKWIREKLLERTLDFIERNLELCTLPDEHALSAVLDGRMASLSPIWNARGFVMRSPVVRAMLDPVLIHYDGPSKPWKRFGRDKRLFDDPAGYRLYVDFIMGTPWAGWLREQWTAKDFWQTIEAGANRVSDRLKGRPTRAMRDGYERYISAFAQSCLELPFADVEQGITLREAGRLRLDPARTKPSPPRVQPLGTTL